MYLLQSTHADNGNKDTIAFVYHSPKPQLFIENIWSIEYSTPLTKSSEIKEKKHDTSFGAAFLSVILGPGTGEWLVNDTQNFTQCLIEHLILLIPIIGLFNWVGSVMDAYNKEPEPQANWLFTTMDLRPSSDEVHSTSLSD